ncbi:GH32 C-terminal domain-containing protein [Deinococcus hopiensis]|uniref:GH32 C-terminal domain-containing protein n=1 Tax=Deinococcus hopiensis TaxID=309885 RepID=UPI002481B3DB|nr:GH32 C-terminal domain-containing protein [Deinococcus hopiensis]
MTLLFIGLLTSCGTIQNQPESRSEESRVGVTPRLAAQALTERYRPQYHFTPQVNWMNDPNGLVYYAGEYHLFYQYNPSGTKWGNMSWGHAVSTDLVHWQELPVAISHDANEAIFSGSAVVDVNNTSGFGNPASPAMVAVYTSANKATGKQTQALAYSLDKGRTWTKYANNPVIDINSSEFRDPKVQWYAPTQSWLMTVSMSVDHKVRFYTSKDLKKWDLLSEFGPAGATGGVWECPDLFPLRVDGTGPQKWVLVVNINPGGIAGGSAAQYFIGNFDGTRFIADDQGPYTPPTGTVFQNFEQSTFGSWTTTGTAFGPGPETGSVNSQNPVTGIDGTRFANSYHGYDPSIGTLTSPSFTVNSRYLNFKVGGGNHPYVPGSRPSNLAGTVLADFNGTSYGTWTTSGEAFGTRPASGALPGQQTITGYTGAGLVNTFIRGDATTGTLTSPSFNINKGYINFLIGGGANPWGSANPTAINLIVDSQVVRTATGTNAETLTWASWDVRNLAGQNAQIQIVDQNTGQWGHINLDHVVLTDGVIYEDFDGMNYRGWTATGEAFGTRPATGALPNQQAVTGYVGSGLVNTYVRGDASVGTLTSPNFTLSKGYINFLIGGGAYPWGGANPTALNLIIDGKVVRSATGKNAEALAWTSWDVREFAGRNAQFQVVDQNTGQWGHINLDHLLFSDSPVEGQSTETAVNLLVGGNVVQSVTGSNSENLDWASFNLSQYQGQQAQIQIVDRNTSGWGHILADQFVFADSASMSSLQRVNWVDWGKDYYAAIAWENNPDGKRYMIGWMNNWNYGELIPTSIWRGAMSIPREMALKTINGKIKLIQQPVQTLNSLRQTPSFVASNLSIASGARSLGTGANNTTSTIEATFSLGQAKKFGIKVRTAESEETTIGYDAVTQEVYVDRTRSGDVAFSPDFPGIQRAPLAPVNGKVKLRIMVDWSSVEVFGGEGETVITDQIFPSPTSQGVQVFSEGATTVLDRLELWQMNSYR